MGETGGIYRDQALDGDMGRDTEREIRDIVGGGLLKEACVGAGNPTGSQITEEQCAPGWQLPFEALQAQHPHSPLPHLPGLCPLPGEPFCPNLSQTFRSSPTRLIQQILPAFCYPSKSYSLGALGSSLLQGGY